VVGSPAVPASGSSSGSSRPHGAWTQVHGRLRLRCRFAVACRLASFPVVRLTIPGGSRAGQGLRADPPQPLGRVESFQPMGRRPSAASFREPNQEAAMVRRVPSSPRFGCNLLRCSLSIHPTNRLRDLLPSRQARRIASSHGSAGGSSIRCIRLQS